MEPRITSGVDADGWPHVICRCGFHSRIVWPNATENELAQEVARTIKHHRERGCFSR